MDADAAVGGDAQDEDEDKEEEKAKAEKKKPASKKPASKTTKPASKTKKAAADPADLPQKMVRPSPLLLTNRTDSWT